MIKEVLFADWVYTKLLHMIFDCPVSVLCVVHVNFAFVLFHICCSLSYTQGRPSLYPAFSADTKVLAACSACQLCGSRKPSFSSLLRRNTPMMLCFSLWLQILQSWLYVVRANIVILFSHRSCRSASCSSPANIAAPFAFDACQPHTCPLREQTGA